MSVFIDNLLSGTWNIQCNNGQFIGIDPSRRDANGNSLATTVETRHDAMQLDFQKVRDISPTNVVVTAQAQDRNVYLMVNGQGQVVFASNAGEASQFNAVRMSITTFSLGQGVSGSSEKFMTLDTSDNIFTMADGEPGPDAGLFLAPDLPVGAQIWRFQTPQRVIGTPYVYHGAVLAGDGDTLINCVDMLTSKVIWKYGDGTGAVCPPEVNYAHNLVYVGDDSGLLHAVDLNSGQQCWTFQSSAPVYARPSAYVERLFVPSSDGVLYALSNETGQLSWRYPLNDNCVGFFASPAMAGETVFVGGWDNQLHAIDVNSGQVIWTYDASNKVNGGIEVNDDTVFFGTDNGQMIALDQKNGQTRWVMDSRGIVSGKPCLYKNLLFYGNFAGEFYAINANTGQQVWKKTFDGYIGSAPQAADGVVYFNTTNGLLYALDASNGDTLATYDAGADMDGSMILLSGALYFGTQGGALMSVTERLDGKFNPMDTLTLLALSGYADLHPSEERHDVSHLLAGWTQLAEFKWTQDTTFATGALIRLRLPGTDEEAVVVAMGVQTDKYARYLTTSNGALTDVPDTILGSNAPAGVKANISILDSYLDVRDSILSTLQSAPNSTVVVAGLGCGGTLATLAALDLGIPKPDVPIINNLSLVTFGAPAAGNQAFANLFNERVTNSFRVVSVADKYPDLLPTMQGYRHVNRLLTIGVLDSPTGSCTYACYRSSLTGCT